MEIQEERREVAPVVASINSQVLARKLWADQSGTIQFGSEPEKSKLRQTLDLGEEVTSAAELCSGDKVLRAISEDPNGPYQLLQIIEKSTQGVPRINGGNVLKGGSREKRDQRCTQLAHDLGIEPEKDDATPLTRITVIHFFKAGPTGSTSSQLAEKAFFSTNVVKILDLPKCSQ